MIDSVHFNILYDCLDAKHLHLSPQLKQSGMNIHNIFTAMVLNELDYIRVTMSQQLLALGGVAALVLFFIKHVIQVKKDPLEPVFLDATVPYFGHVMGILVQKTSYYLKLRYLFVGYRGEGQD